jgi:rhamnosyltransferase
MRVSVIIPTCQAGEELARLLQRLREQRLPPREIIVIDSASTDRTVEIARSAGCLVESIDRVEFGHGRTRNRAARGASADVLVFLTQDALPTDGEFLARLVAPIASGEASASYARQVPRDDADDCERLLREFNYPSQGRLKTPGDLAEDGMGAIFLSNVAAAYHARTFHALGGFREDVIMNEDMLLCATLLRSGRSVAYRADATVYHSHRYTLAEHFRRYFDIGVFFSTNADDLARVRCTGRGMRLVWMQLRRLLGRGRLRSAGAALAQAAARFAGYHVGRRHRLIPRRWQPRLSLHPSHWSAPARPSSPSAHARS